MPTCRVCSSLFLAYAFFCWQCGIIYLYKHPYQATFEFTANAQIWPRAINTLIGGTADGIYLIVTDIGSKKGSGLDFILGQTFFERFYSVYDTANQQVGLATTSFTDATSN
jgi:cathepsin E